MLGSQWHSFEDSQPLQNILQTVSKVSMNITWIHCQYKFQLWPHLVTCKVNVFRVQSSRRDLRQTVSDLGIWLVKRSSLVCPILKLGWFLMLLVSLLTSSSGLTISHNHWYIFIKVKVIYIMLFQSKSRNCLELVTFSRKRFVIFITLGAWKSDIDIVQIMVGRWTIKESQTMIYWTKIRSISWKWVSAKHKRLLLKYFSQYVGVSPVVHVLQV